MRCSPRRPVRCHSTNSSSFPTYWADSSQERSSAHVRQGRGAGGGHPAVLRARLRGDLAGRADGGHGYPSGQPVRGLRRQDGAFQGGRRRVRPLAGGVLPGARWPRSRRLAGPCPDPARGGGGLLGSVPPGGLPGDQRGHQRQRARRGDREVPARRAQHGRRCHRAAAAPGRGGRGTALPGPIRRLWRPTSPRSCRDFSQRARDGADTDELSRVAELALVAWPSGD